MDYKLITNELWMDYKVMDGNSCEWISFIIRSCSMLVFVTYFHFGMFTTSFNLVIFWVWCMSFYEIVLSHMILQVILIFFWGMWAHCSWSHSPIYMMFGLWYHDWRNKPTTFILAQWERWPIGWSPTYLPFILGIHL